MPLESECIRLINMIWRKVGHIVENKEEGYIVLEVLRALWNKTKRQKSICFVKYKSKLIYI
jgi:hypothetical protein